MIYHYLLFSPWLLGVELDIHMRILTVNSALFYILYSIFQIFPRCVRVLGMLYCIG
jgi:hypothetical protein